VFWPVSGSGGGFQCTELAQRYLYDETGGDLASSSGEAGNPWGGLSGEGFAAAASQKYGFVLHNSTSGQVPVIGDIISEAHGQAPTTAGRYYNVGDVGIVTSVTSNAITIIAQNNNAQGTNTITMNSPTNWVINKGSAYQYTYFEWIDVGNAANHPAVAVWPSGTVNPAGQQDVFWKGYGNNSLFEAVWSPTTLAWSPWRNISSVNNESGSPAVAVNAPMDQEEVFWKGTNGGLWEIYWDRNGWHGPVDNGMGPLGSDPSVAVWPSGTVNPAGQQDVFWKGYGNNNLYEAVWTNNRWSAKGPVPNVDNVDSAPTVAINAAMNQEEVFWKGTNGDLWEIYWDRNGWHGPVDNGMGPLG
jgi:hypothetical protein